MIITSFLLYIPELFCLEVLLDFETPFYYISIIYSSKCACEKLFFPIIRNWLRKYQRLFYQCSLFLILYLHLLLCVYSPNHKLSTCPPPMHKYHSHYIQMPPLYRAWNLAFHHFLYHFFKFHPHLILHAQFEKPIKNLYLLLVIDMRWPEWCELFPNET